MVHAKRYPLLSIDARSSYRSNYSFILDGVNCDPYDLPQPLYRGLGRLGGHQPFFLQPNNEKRGMDRKNDFFFADSGSDTTCFLGYETYFLNGAPTPLFLKGRLLRRVQPA